ncbi:MULTISPECIES: hypothetical protein [Cobetia]|uniref:hypothetical protein n=1 Tax=Cobetia TaxID=204286 RepID=UPI00158228D8|nr:MULTISPECIES: hypothetical protein [Cobetia]MDI4659719.1 hypothetical protein [Cobetia sp. BMC6]NUJ55125.1 hypothetical protein [Cobetia marina]
MFTSDSRTQVALIGGRGDQVLGEPDDAALAEQWHNAEIRTRILKLARPLKDLLPPQTAESVAAQAQTICHLSRDQRWQLPGEQWQLRSQGSGWQLERNGQPATAGETQEAPDQLSLAGLTDDVTGMQLGNRPLPRALWTLAAARHRGERHSVLAIAQISSVREALCWGELVSRLRAPNGRPPRIVLTLSHCTLPTLEASLYFLMPWLDGITLTAAPGLETACLGVIKARFRLAEPAELDNATDDVFCRTA